MNMKKKFIITYVYHNSERVALISHSHVRSVLFKSSLFRRFCMTDFLLQVKPQLFVIDESQ